MHKHKPQNHDRTAELLKTLMGGDAPVDREFLADLGRRTAEAFTGGGQRRRLMSAKSYSRWAAAAVVLVGAAVLIGWLLSATPTAYAWEQTAAAFSKVRFLHVQETNAEGQIVDERWIEIGPNGRQIRYRQEDTDSTIVENDGTVAVIDHERKTVAVYRSDQQQYQWIGEVGAFLEHVGRDAVVLETDCEYQGRTVHRVQTALGKCIIDAASKLPIEIGNTSISYEAPAQDVFALVYPDGYAVHDRREEGSQPDEATAAVEQADRDFGQACQALVQGDWATAGQLYGSVVQVQAKRNWAWFWLGRSQYETGLYADAAASFSRVIEMMGGAEYAHLARGLAYARLGRMEAAGKDLGRVVEMLVLALDRPSLAGLLAYADDPRVRWGRKPSDEEMRCRAINALRTISGRNFGYDPDGPATQREQALEQWRQWLKDGAHIDVDFGVEQIPLKPFTDPVDPLLTAEAQPEEIEEMAAWQVRREQVDQGGDFLDCSLPVRTLLSVETALKRNDIARVAACCGQDREEIERIVTPEVARVWLEQLAGQSIYRAPLPPADSAEGDFWPVFVASESGELADAHLFVRRGDRWLLVGNMGNPHDDWREAAKKMAEMPSK